MVVDHCTARFESWLNRFVSCVGFADFADGPNSHLRGEAELFPHPSVDFLLEFDFAAGSELVGYGCDVVACLVEAAHGFEECVELCLVGF